ncbi:MAG: cupin domain-containing protein [Nitrospirae bacterium]|nr:cupin domain-containing protein [Nitrospirota bacterium]MBF0535905.1 cupin domain-containing protein [Nitrospirota bacterium]MBF0617762.1 cupin domain-containing protein [Nitrospirota bacterium]
MDVSVVKPDEKELKQLGVKSWPIWSKEASKFDWSYDSTEECYILEGKVEVVTKDGKKVEFGKGDFVTFPKGLACTWDIKEAVRKHYNFK